MILASKRTRGQQLNADLKNFQDEKRKEMVRERPDSCFGIAAVFQCLGRDQCCSSMDGSANAIYPFHEVGFDTPPGGM
jgi:hypothetical protein